jgi:hypothetical protein
VSTTTAVRALGELVADGVVVRRRGRGTFVAERAPPPVAASGQRVVRYVFDDFAVGYDVTAAMLDRGHRAPAMLWSESDVTSVRDRLSGHYRALRERGLPELPERSALRGYDPLEPAARRQLLRSMLESPERLTALICGNAPTLALAVSDLLAMFGCKASAEQFTPRQLVEFAGWPCVEGTRCRPTHGRSPRGCAGIWSRAAGAEQGRLSAPWERRPQVVLPYALAAIVARRSFSSSAIASSSMYSTARGIVARYCSVRSSSLKARVKTEYSNARPLIGSKK